MVQINFKHISQVDMEKSESILNNKRTCNLLKIPHSNLSKMKGHILSQREIKYVTWWILFRFRQYLLICAMLLRDSPQLPILFRFSAFFYPVAKASFVGGTISFNIFCEYQSMPAFLFIMWHWYFSCVLFLSIRDIFVSIFLKIPAIRTRFTMTFSASFCIIITPFPQVFFSSLRTLSWINDRIGNLILYNISVHYFS